MPQQRADIEEQPESDDAAACDHRQTTICILLIGVLFVISRVFYVTFLNVGFDASPLAYYVQYLDPRLLKEDLLRSLLNLHSQPPAFNLFLGLVLKAFPQLHDIVFHIIFLAAGLLMAWFLYLTMAHSACDTQSRPG